MFTRCDKTSVYVPTNVIHALSCVHIMRSNLLSVNSSLSCKRFILFDQKQKKTTMQELCNNKQGVKCAVTDVSTTRVETLTEISSDSSSVQYQGKNG